MAVTAALSPQDVGNAAPRLCSEFHVAWQKGDLKTALKLHDKLMPLHTNLFIESNPASRR